MIQNLHIGASRFDGEGKVCKETVREEPASWCVTESRNAMTHTKSPKDQWLVILEDWPLVQSFEWSNWLNWFEPSWTQHQLDSIWPFKHMTETSVAEDVWSDYIFSGRGRVTSSEHRVSSLNGWPILVWLAVVASLARVPFWCSFLSAMVLKFLSFCRPIFCQPIFSSQY